MTSEDEERPCKKARLFGSLEEIVTLIAGEEPDKKSFIVHKDVLCEASPFFKAACKPEWMKSVQKVINLPEDNAEVIQMMIYWMYHNESGVKMDDAEAEIDSVKKAMKSTLGLFAQLYVVGQKYQMPQLQNDALDAVLNEYKTGFINGGITTWVYQNTIPGDNLRKLIFRSARRNFDTTDFATFGSTFCREFLFDMAYGLVDAGEMKLEENEAMDSVEDPEYDFCENLHHVGGCDGDCKTVKEYTVFPQETDE